MQAIMTNNMVAHVWAQGKQYEGRNGSKSFYFEGPALYSYGNHYMVGFRVSDELTLLNDESAAGCGGGKGITTSGHRGTAWSASYHGANGKAPVGVPDLTELGYALRYLVGDRYLPVNRSRAVMYVKTWANRNALVDPEKVKFIMDLFKLSRSFAKIQRDAEKARDRKKRQELKEANEVSKADIRDLMNTTGRTMKAGLDEQLQIANPESYQLKFALDFYRNTDRRILAALKFANAHKYPKRTTEHLRALRRFLKADSTGYEHKHARRVATRETRQMLRVVRSVSNVLNGKTEQLILPMGTDYLFRRALFTANAQNPDSQAEAMERAVITGVDIAGHLQDSRHVSMALLRTLEKYRVECGPSADRLLGIREARRVAALDDLTRQREAEQREKLGRWLEGEKVWIGHVSDDRGGALVRAVDVERDEAGALTDGTIETSWGATVPLMEAVRVYKAVARCKRAGLMWHKNGDRLSVGHFEIESIQANGNFRAGCHRFNWEAIQSLAVKLGITQPAV